MATSPRDARDERHDARVGRDQPDVVSWAGPHSMSVGASDLATAMALSDVVAANWQSVLTGIRNAEILISGHA